MLQSKQYNYFKIASVICLIYAICLVAYIIMLGKQESFLNIHLRHTPFLDYFFTYWTFFGDNMIIIPVLLFCILFRRDLVLPMIIAYVICVLLTQLLKRIVFPDDLRPVSLEIENLKLRRVLGNELRVHNSFPSGHTSIAFTLALMSVFFANNKFWAFVLPLLALLVGYSRIYLGQHFVTDVLGGMCVSLVAVWITILLLIRRSKKERPTGNNSKM